MNIKSRVETKKSRVDKCLRNNKVKPVLHLATLFARREAKTRIWHRDWLKLAGEKIPPRTLELFLLFCLFAQTKSPSGKRA